MRIKAPFGKPRANPYYQGPKSPHFDGTRFFNPGGIEPLGLKGLLRWQTEGGRQNWPKRWPEQPQFHQPPRQVGASDLRVTMLGHATLLLQVGGLNILTDPVFSDRASPLAAAGPKRVNPPGVRFDDLPPIDIVLLTHNHYDHLDIASLARLQAAHDPLVITPLGNDRIVHARVPKMRVQVQDWGDVLELPDVTIHCEPAHHWSARGMFDRRMALWAAFVIETGAGKIYHIGDTGFHDGINYRAVAAKHGALRLAVLPIGAYEPQWFMRAQHQNPAEAVEGMQLCGAQHAVGHHWGTFQLTNEAIATPVADLQAALDRAKIDPDRFRALPPGTFWDVP